MLKNFKVQLYDYLLHCIYNPSCLFCSENSFLFQLIIQISQLLGNDLFWLLFNLIKHKEKKNFFTCRFHLAWDTENFLESWNDFQKCWIFIICQWLSPKKDIFYAKQEEKNTCLNPDQSSFFMVSNGSHFLRFWIFPKAC